MMFAKLFAFFGGNISSTKLFGRGQCSEIKYLYNRIKNREFVNTFTLIVTINYYITDIFVLYSTMVMVEDNSKNNYRLILLDAVNGGELGVFAHWNRWSMKKN